MYRFVLLPAYRLRCVAEAIKRKNTEEVGKERDLFVMIHHPPFQDVHLVLLA